ncbi:MAG: hypothetical protein K9K67_08260 [Bacteriovoracaceae bacterium]|nr:hypothetical protein [Bacteriovoracaceae bacterium]
MKTLIKVVLYLISLNSNAATNYADLSFGLGSVDPNKELLTAISAKVNRNYQIEKKLFEGDILLGGGIRATNYRSNLYQTQTDHIEVIEKVSVTAFNLMFESLVKWEKVFVGLNIDFIGFSLKGTSRIQNTNKEISNSSFNLLRGGENDKGTLNSQIFVGFQFDSFYTRVGLSHSAIEFEGQVTNSAAERQNFVDVLFVGIGYLF